MTVNLHLPVPRQYMIVNDLIDQRKFNPAKYESMYHWLYYSHSKGGFLCKFSFSLMGNLLTAKRNRLAQTNLDATMRICHRNEDLTNADLEI